LLRPPVPCLGAHSGPRLAFPSAAGPEAPYGSPYGSALPPTGRFVRSAAPVCGRHGVLPRWNAPSTRPSLLLPPETEEESPWPGPCPPMPSKTDRSAAEHVHRLGSWCHPRPSRPCPSALCPGSTTSWHPTP